MLGIGRKPVDPSKARRIVRHAIVLRVSGGESNCMSFVQSVLRLATSTFDCCVKFERYDSDVVVTSTQGEQRIE